MKLSQLLNITDTKLDLSRWNNKEKNNILNHLNKTTDLNEYFTWNQRDDFNTGMIYILPYWFLLTCDSELLLGLSKHPLMKQAIAECKELEKKHNNKIGMPLLNIMDYPFFFNYDLNAIKKLIDLGCILDNKFISSMLREKQYHLILNIYKENLLKFDEQKIIEADPLHLMSDNNQNTTLLDKIITNIEEQDENDKLETLILVEHLFKLGLKNSCHINNNLSIKLKKLKDDVNKELKLEELLKYLPKSLVIYEKIKLNNDLSVHLTSSTQYQQKNKVKI